MRRFLLGKGLKIMLNNLESVNKIAHILDLNMKSGGADLRILLKGERDPIFLSLDCVLDGETLCVTNVKANKEWVNYLTELFKHKYSRINLGKHGKYARLAKYLL